MIFTNIEHQYKKYCLYERGMTAYNCKCIIRNVKTLLEYAQTDNVKKIDVGIVREFLNEFSKKRDWAPKTYRLYLQNFSSFFQWCIKTGIVSKNPTRGIEKPRIPKRLPRSLTKEQAQVILSQTTWYPWRYNLERTRNEAIISMFLFTGLRLQELINLRVIDVNLENQEIMVIQGKGRKDRIVPIHPRLLLILRGYFRELRRTQKNQVWLFAGTHFGKRLASKNIQEICRKISKASGIKFTPHMLRHTFARLSIDADLNLYKLKEIMGHSDVSTTQIYLSISTEGIKKSFNKLTLI